MTPTKNYAEQCAQAKNTLFVTILCWCCCAKTPTKAKKQEFNTSYKEMIDAGVSRSQAKKAMKDSYKYFDELRSQNLNNPFFDI